MKYYIALDIGGTNFRGALFDENFNIVKRQVNPTKRGILEDFYGQAKDLITSLLCDDVCSIGIGVPGRVRKSDGYIYALPNMDIYETDLASYLTKEFNLPVSIENDAAVASLGEAVLGAGKSNKSLYFVTISTGLGGGICIDKNIRMGSDEIGHTLISYKNKFYEREKLVSGTGIVNLAKLNKLKITKSYELFNLVELGDKKALKVFEDWYQLLKDFFKLIHNTFNPDVIAVTGGVMKSKKYFFERLQNECNFKIVECEVGEDAGLYGAAKLACNIYDEI